MQNLDFWAQAQQTARYLSDKARDSTMHHYEITMHSQLCSMLEKYYKMVSNKLDLEIIEIAKHLEDYLDEQEDINPDSSEY